MILRSLIIICVLTISAFAQFLPVNFRPQEKNNWQGHGATQSILEYYGSYISQTAIGLYTTPGAVSNPMNLVGETQQFGLTVRGVNLALNHFAGIQSSVFNRPLSWSEIISHLTLGRPIVLRANSVFGTRILIISGVASGQNLHIIDPWPSHGPMIVSYNTLLNDGTSQWVETLVITSPRPPPPPRPIVENDVPKAWVLYAFDQLQVNDGVTVFRDPTTTTLYGQVGSGWQHRAYACPDNSFGVNIGVAANVGNIHSSGPVWLRDRARIFGSVFKSPEWPVTQQSNVTIHGSIVNSFQAYRGFAYGNINFAGIPQNLIMVEPGQPTVNLAPGRYWGYHLKPTTTLRLSSGDYFFNTLNLEQSNLILDVTNGPIRVYVASNLQWRTQQSFVGGNGTRFQLTYLGSNTISLESNTQATVLAPNAELVLGQSQKNFLGMFVGKSLTVHQHTTIRFQGFAF